MTLTSPSFPKGAQTDRSEADARSDRKLSMVDVIRAGVDHAGERCPYRNPDCPKCYPKTVGTP